MQVADCSPGPGRGLWRPIPISGKTPSEFRNESAFPPSIHRVRPRRLNHLSRFYIMGYDALRCLVRSWHGYCLKGTSGRLKCSRIGKASKVIPNETQSAEVTMRIPPRVEDVSKRTDEFAQMARRVLDGMGGNRERVAECLGISVTMLNTLMGEQSILRGD